MALTRQDALRLLRFCLGPDDSGTVEVADDGAALVTISPAEPSIGVRTFEAGDFESALRQAADAGLLKSACVEKQISFLDSGTSRGPAASDVLAAARAARPDMFPRLIGATGALLHETQVERGLSAIYAASGRRTFRRELGRQRERTDARNERLLTLWRELEPAAGSSLARRIEQAEARLRSLATARAGIDSGDVAPVAIVDVYSAANAELLAVGDGALVAFSPPAQRAGAVACIVMLYAKEKTGIERARIGAALASHQISDEDRRLLASLVAARSSYLHVFSATAPRPAEQLLERALASPTSADLARSEDLLLSGRETELDLDARGWFTLVSRNMDLLGEIGGVALGLVGDTTST
jgi:methyl-accepting chemotaxis protein